MHSPWTSRREFGTIAGELAEKQDRDFERAVLPFVRAVWPAAWISPARQQFDNAGIDLYVGKPPHFDVVIQCKGFLEREVLQDQIAQCRESLRAFAKSRFTTEHFCLLFNRHKETPRYKADLERELDALRPAKAREAILWNHRDLLIKAFDSMQERVLRAITLKTSAMRDEQELAERVIGGDALRVVPLETSEMKINASRLRSVSSSQVVMSDALQAILAGDRRRVGVLIAPAGFGKTTTVLRALRETSDFCVFLPAARIRGDMANAHSVFEAALDPEDVVGEASDEDRGAWRRMVGPVMKYLTQSEKRDLIVIIDALDEAPALEHSYDLHLFFNILGRVKVPVIVTMRKEFWSSRRGDFDATFGEAAEKESTTQTLRMIELLPWDEQQIVAVATAFRDKSPIAESKRRVDDFINAVQTGRFADLYGDIPRTPLFLKFILDVLEHEDAERMNRVDLLMHWIRLKIARDVVGPARFGGARVEIAPGVNGLDDTVAASFDAMRHASVAMTKADEDRVELLPSCTFDDVRQRMGPDAPASATALMLNSLLIPFEDRRVDGTQRMRFAHRVFQEFFLASAVVDRAVAFGGTLPDAVMEWIAAFRRS